MSKFIGFIVGAIEIGIGIATGNVALIVSGAAMIVSNAVMLLTMPKAPARQAAEMTLQLGEQPRCAIFGEAFGAGSLVDGFNYGGKYGTDWECLLIRLADHKCEGLTGFYVDDQYVAYRGNGNYSEFDGTHFELYFRSDTTNQALPGVLTTNGPGWGTGYNRGDSGCDVLVCYRADTPDAKKPAWPGGRPRFGFVVKGKLCYDPRKDSTVAGGSGAHRWDDPSTWEYSDNPAVCRYNWIRGIFANDDVSDPGALLIGRGLSAAEAPPENVAAPANLCDEMVGSPSAKRYRVAGPIYANQQFLEVEEMFAAATAGNIVTREGSVELEPGQAKSVAATFTDADLLSGSSASWNEGILSDASGEWGNTVVARYVEPAQQWQDHAAPVVRDTADIAADGRPREINVTLRLVAWAAQALRVAEVTRRIARIWGRGQVALGPRFCEIEEGDWVNWQSDRRFGGSTHTFRVEAYSIDEKWRNKLTLRQINSTVFSEGTFDPDQSEANPSDIPPDIGAPDGANWTLTAELLSGDGATVPAIVISGDATDDPYAHQVRFEYWKADGVIDPIANPDDPDWANAGTFGPGVTRREIVSVVSGADYYAAVTYVVQGIPGDRLVLGPVTAGTLTSPTASMGDLPTIYVDADYTGTILTGELPLTFQGRRFQGNDEVTLSATWSGSVSLGDATVTDLTPTNGLYEVTALSATSEITVVSDYGGVALSKFQRIELRLGPPPTSGGGTSTATDSTINSISSATPAAITDELTVTVGASGTVDLTAPLTVKTDKSGPEASYPVAGRWQWWNGSAWVDLGASDTASSPDCYVYDANGGEPGTSPFWRVSAGTLNVSASKSSLTPGASEKFRLRAKNASGTRTMTFTGTATATSS